MAVRAGLSLGLALGVLAILSRFGFVPRLIVVRRSRVSTGVPLPLLAPERKGCDRVGPAPGLVHPERHGGPAPGGQATHPAWLRTAGALGRLAVA